MASTISSIAGAQAKRLQQMPGQLPLAPAAPGGAAPLAGAAPAAMAPAVAGAGGPVAAPAIGGTPPPGPSGARSVDVANEMRAFGVTAPGRTEVPKAGPVGKVKAPTIAPGQTGAVDDPFRQQIYSQLQTMLNGGLDRSDLVRQQYENLRPILQEQYNANVESTGQRAAAFGRGGMGQTQSAFANLARQRTADEQRILNDLILKATEQEKADLFQALGQGTDLSRLMSSDILAREQMGTQRDITGAQLGLQASMANQGAGLQQSLQGQQLGFQAGESAAGRGLQAGLAGQQLGMERLNTLDQMANQQNIAQTQAGAQMAAAQAAASASVAAAQIGASSAEQRQAAQIAFDKELARQNGMLDLARLEEGARQFDTTAMQQQQAFQYGMGRDATGDQFRLMDLAGQYGYLNEPTLNAANAGLQGAYGTGVSNYGANAQAINQGIGQTMSDAAALWGSQYRPFPGLDPTTLATINW